MVESKSGFVPIGSCKIYFEESGEGQPLVMIHAGVADSRQWNNEFRSFADRYRVVRYDLRGYGKSRPVDEEFSHLADLEGLLDALGIAGPAVLMGCSMGGTLAMDYALATPAKVAALIMVGSGPSGLRLDVPSHPKADEADAAYDAGDMDRVAELETQIWFDGMGRAPQDVNPDMRSLAYDMNHIALAHDALHLGTRRPDAENPAADRMASLNIPVLIVVGEHDIPFIHAAAELMANDLPNSRKVVIPDAAHLSNMDHPVQFQSAVTAFLDDVLH